MNLQHKPNFLRRTIIFFLAVFLAFVWIIAFQEAKAAPINAVADTVQPDTRCAGGMWGFGGCPPGLEFAHTLLDSPRYAGLRSNFLNVDSETLSEVSFSSLTDQGLSDMLAGGGDFNLDWNEHLPATWGIYGANYSCTNKHGEKAACFLNSGGQGFEGGSEPACGQSTGDSITNAQNPSYQCQTPTTWAGFDYWLGTNSNTDFIVDHFYKDGYKSVNRLCVEMELPQNNLVIDAPDIKADPSLSQVMNMNTLHPNLRELSFHWGSYTSPRFNDAGTTLDEERGGTYQGGGSHFYHVATSYGSYPSDRVYALDENTIVACMSNRPAGVRTPMRMPYAWEPLATMGGVDANGETQAASYFNHLTRIYFRLQDTVNITATHPLTLKINKFFMMYEDNDIFAATGTGAVLSEKMVVDLEYADHPFTVYNNANESRTYRTFLFNRDTLPIKPGGFNDQGKYVLYDDANGNGVIDVGEPEIRPYELVTLAANTDKKLIIRQYADFTGWYGCYTHHGRCMTQGSFAIQETTTLRSAGFHTRLWEGTVEDQATQEAFFATAKYPSTDSDWYTNRQYNTEKDPSTNPHLIRNTRDYQMAKTKGGW